jgi:hypothetical protein
MAGSSRAVRPVGGSAQLIVWTSGEADLDVGDIATGAVTVTHYEMSSAAELATCLDDLTSQLTAPAEGS